MLNGYIPIKIRTDVLAAFRSIPKQSGSVGQSATFDLAPYIDFGYPPWILSIYEITYHDAPDIGQTNALPWNGDDWVTLSGSEVTWIPPASTENRRYYITMMLTFPELMALSFDQTITLDVPLEALWTNNNNEPLWTDKNGFPLWTK